MALASVAVKYWLGSGVLGEGGEGGGVVLDGGVVGWSESERERERDRGGGHNWKGG